MNKKIRAKIERAPKERPKYHLTGRTGGKFDPDRCPCGKMTKHLAFMRNHNCRSLEEIMEDKWQQLIQEK